MTCAEARRSLLTAEPDELAGRGDSPTALHVRGCERCALLAARMLDGHGALAAALEAPRPRWTADEALDRTLAAAPAAGDASPDPDRPELPFRKPLRKPHGDPARIRRITALAAPLAAAASLAAMLLLGRDAPAPKPLPVTRLADRSPPETVEVPAGRSAGVFATSNPKITVVWLY